MSSRREESGRTSEARSSHRAFPLPRYRSGSERIDEAIVELLQEVGQEVETRDVDLLFEMIVSCIRMAREGADRGELKLVNNALKELRYSFLVFAPYEGIRKAAIFGSARIRRDSAEYEAARRVGENLAKQGWMVMTGAGPGIMSAGIEGAGAENAFGVNILLPFESEPSEFIAGDPKLINFKYFFTRKLMFMKEAHGFVLLPGGFGTLDETFELLTLMQTGRSPVAPVVLLDPPGSSYWHTWKQFVDREVRRRGLISDDDLAFVRITDDPDVASRIVVDFYKVFHSLRFVGARLVLRLKREPTPRCLERLNREFRDIVVTGKIEAIEPTRAEREDEDHLDLPRIAFHFDRRSYARLREMVDVLNEELGCR